MRIDDLDTIVARGGDELERVYRGDHIIVWEPGDWYVSLETGSTLQTGVDYLLGFVLYDPNNIQPGGYMYAYQWTLADFQNTVGIVNNCLPIRGATERRLSRSEYESYFGTGQTYSLLFNVSGNTLQLKGTNKFLSMTAPSGGTDMGRGLLLDYTGCPFTYGAETGSDLRLSNNNIDFAVMYHYYGDHVDRPVIGTARRSQAPVCEDYCCFVNVYRLERKRTYHYE